MIRCQPSLFLAGLMAALSAFGATAQVMPGLGLPLYFEAGNAPAGAPQYLARSRASEVLISATQVQISVRHAPPVQVQFPGANPQAQIHGRDEQAGKINYLIGNHADQWRTGVPTFAQVGIENLYPGINAVYYGNEQQLEYDFTIAPGAKPDAISLRITGARNISLNPAGELAMAVGNGNVFLRKPMIYQTVAGRRQEIAGGYKIAGQTVTFSIGNYDPSAALVIDPILTYSSYLGGNSEEEALAVAVDTNDGSFFIAGQTEASNLGTTGAAQTGNAGGLFGDAFIAKFMPVKTSTNQSMSLVYFTYLGGSQTDVADSIAVDPLGNAFVGGYTDSPNFPTKGQLAGLSNQIHGSINGAGTYYLDGFVAELAPNGASLVYSTYLGGSQEDSIQALAIDAQDNAFVTGYTLSTNLPVKNPVVYTLAGSSSPTLSTLACLLTDFNCNAFIAKISPLGTNLDWMTYFGGTNFDWGTGIAVDGSDNVYVTGFTDSTNFPNTNSFQPLLNQTALASYVNLVFDGFVAKLGAATTNPPPLLYSTFLGNTNSDEAKAITVDAHGAAYVTGFTTSTNFYNTTTGLLVTSNLVSVSGGQNNYVFFTNTTYPLITTRITNNVNGIVYTTNVFLTKIVQTNASGPASIAYSVVFGGSYEDIGYGVAVDPVGNAFVVGTGNSPDFPTNNAFGLLTPVGAGNNDIFITAFNSTCSNVLYSAHLGGVDDDWGFGIAVDNHSTAYVVGLTTSPNFPVTTNSTDFTNFATNAVIYGARAKTINSSGLDAVLAVISLDLYAPSLSLTRTNTRQVTLSWPVIPEAQPEIAGYSLESTTNLATGPWIPVTNAITAGTNLNFVTIPDTNAAQYFRLTNNAY